MWTHKESGRRYVGSAVDLSKRLKDYFSPFYLKRAKNYMICFHQNIQQIAGSCLGIKGSEQTKQKLREANSGEKNPNFGKSASAETRVKLSKAKMGIGKGIPFSFRKGGT